MNDPINYFIAALMGGTVYAIALLIRELYEEDKETMANIHADTVISQLAICTTPVTTMDLVHATGLGAHTVLLALSDLQQRNRVSKTRTGHKTLWWIKGSKITARDLLTQKWDQSTCL